jgi:hypothetical protein
MPAEASSAAMAATALPNFIALLLPIDDQNLKWLIGLHYFSRLLSQSLITHGRIGFIAGNL